MVDSISNKISLSFKEDLDKILNKVKESDDYSEEQIKLTSLKNKSVFEDLKLDINNHLFGKIHHSDSKTTFSGCLNENLERNLYGINEYPTGDIYLGHYIHNTKTGKGCYIVNPIVENSKKRKSKVNYELYNGSFNGDKKHGLGTYTRITENSNNNEIENSDIDAFIGLFDNDKRHKGIYLEKLEDSFCAYYGNFQNGLKHDSKALLYENSNDRVFRARFENGNPIQGYVVKFHNDEHTEISYVIFDTAGKIKNIILEANIDKETVEKISNECKTFRNILYEDDCFGKCYTNAKSLIKNVSSVKEVKDFNSEEGYKTLVDFLNNSSEQDAFKSVYKHLG